MVSAEASLRELGIQLPQAPTPFGAYVEAVQTGDLLFLSGMLPVENQKPKLAGMSARNWTAWQAGKQRI